jgi:LacI family transcriptional regulator
MIARGIEKLVIHAASRLKIKIPETISVVGIGDFKGSLAIEPPLTTVRLPARRIGQLAADALINKSKRDVPQYLITSFQHN